MGVELRRLCTACYILYKVILRNEEGDTHQSFAFKIQASNLVFKHMSALNCMHVSEGCRLPTFEKKFL